MTESVVGEPSYAPEYHADPSEAVVAFAISAGADPGALHRFWTAPRKSQQTRYERILLATMEIAREHGYDAVQMRDVAARSGASLASIYTYFQSRDNLAYRAAVVWASLMLSRARVEVAGELEGLGASEQLLARQNAQTAAICGEPNMLALWVHSTMTDDPAVVSAQRDVHWAYWLEDSNGVIPDAEARRNLELAQDVFYARAVRWVFGQDDLESVVQSVTELRRRLLGLG